MSLLYTKSANILFSPIVDVSIQASWEGAQTALMPVLGTRSLPLDKLELLDA